VDFAQAASDPGPGWAARPTRVGTSTRHGSCSNWRPKVSSRPGKGGSR
jgi:hypothetical protein